MSNPHNFAPMVHALRTAGILLDADDIERPGLWLAMNDVFGYATADAEQIQPADVPGVYALWRVFGWAGVVWWVAQRRERVRIPEVREAVMTALQKGETDA